ncbi:MAG: GNAT family N-acetyltransferase [Pseudoxanthomonas sp.]
MSEPGSSAPGIRFRRAEATDAGPLGEFMARNFKAAYGHCSTQANIAAAIDEHYGEPAQVRQIADPSRCNLIAESVEGDWLGHAQLEFDHAAPDGVFPLPAAELARFYVDARFHGRGVAQAMMAEVRRIASGRGAAALWLSVWQDQPQAVRFYGKEGFRIAGRLVFAVGDDPKDDWLMVRAL